MSEFGGLRKHKKTQHALYNELGLGSTTVAAGFPWGGKKFPLGQQSVKNKT